MIGISSAEFKKFGFTHYFNHGNGNITCFVMDTCEHCGEPIQAANFIGGHEKDIPFYLSIGMKPAYSLPAEGYYSDAIEGEACDSCNA